MTGSLRPQGSNADEWLMFLCDHLDVDDARPKGLEYVAVQIAQAIETLEKKVFVPGQWRCPKCDFRLTQSNLYAATGTVGPRDDPGDKCPNCNGSLWRVSAMDDRNEAFKCANDTFDRVEQEVKRNKMLNAVIEKQSLALMKIWMGEADPSQIAKGALEVSAEP